MKDFSPPSGTSGLIQKLTPFFSISGYGEEKYCYFSCNKSLSKALPLVISPLKLVNFGLVSLNKNLEIAISQKTIDGFLFQGPFCVHMVVVFQKSALPTILYFARVTVAPLPHVDSKLEIS